MKRTVAIWLLVGLGGFFGLPWHMTRGGFWSFDWATDDTPSSAFRMMVEAGHWWLAPPLLCFIAVAVIQWRVTAPVRRAKLSMIAAGAGLLLTALQGLLIVRAGPRVFGSVLDGGAIAAPLTAIIGLATAYLLVRQQFRGKDAFEFSTMLSFAIPGTVIGVSYIMAFNFPPIELTGTSAILVIVFVFRNMPVGVRGGIAAMSQLDRSLDEASVTLGANSSTTVRRVILPLMGPAILAALTYSFVRAITSVSAVIFLVSARHNMATSFIVGRVENGEFGIAIAYSAVLIVTMLTAILALQALIGVRRLRRVDRVQSMVRA